MGDGLLSLCWNNHRSTFCHIVSTLREKERYSDATLACEGKFYPVHKLVLSVCSEYFDAMLSSTPCKHPVIVLKDVKPEDLESLLSYMYDGVVSVSQNDLARLIKAAEMLRIKGLAYPDETLPLKEEKKPMQNVATTANSTVLAVAPNYVRHSPQPKRRKREENLGPIEVTAGLYVSSPTSSPPVCTQPQEFEQSKLRQRLESQRTDQPQVSTIQVVVDESLVKEELGENEQLNKGAAMSYGVLVTGDSGADQRDDTQVTTQRFETHTIPVTSHQSQPLAEAVAEALAGPSTMQTWLTTGEITPAFTSVESYTTEAGGDGQPNITQAQQLEEDFWTYDGRVQPRRLGNGAYPCPFCNRSTFKQLSDLKRHVRTHTGEKPYHCPYCSYSSAQSAPIKTHILRKHGDLPNTFI